MVSSFALISSGVNPYARSLSWTSLFSRARCIVLRSSVRLAVPVWWDEPTDGIKAAGAGDVIKIVMNTATKRANTGFLIFDIIFAPPLLSSLLLGFAFCVNPNRMQKGHKPLNDLDVYVFDAKYPSKESHMPRRP
jgi:hypothetical protein